jgi:predicted site-specific integrase-resolvase
MSQLLTQDELIAEPFWTPKHVQEHCKISPATYFRWIQEGKLRPGIRFGRTVRHVPSRVREDLKKFDV